jgi:hypothetical protein
MHVYARPVLLCSLLSIQNTLHQMTITTQHEVLPHMVPLEARVASSDELLRSFFPTRKGIGYVGNRSDILCETVYKQSTWWIAQELQKWYSERNIEDTTSRLEEARLRRHLGGTMEVSLLARNGRA